MSAAHARIGLRAGAVGGGGMKFRVGREALGASQVGPAARRGEPLPLRSAVGLEVDGETLTLAATDRYRLAVREVPWVPAAPGMRAAAMVPARTLADVARTMAAGAEVTVAFSTGQAGSGAAAAAGAARRDRGGREPPPRRAPTALASAERGGTAPRRV